MYPLLCAFSDLTELAGTPQGRYPVTPAPSKSIRTRCLNWDEAQATTVYCLNGAEWNQPYLSLDCKDAAANALDTVTVYAGCKSGYMEFDITEAARKVIPIMVSLFGPPTRFLAQMPVLPAKKALIPTPTPFFTFCVLKMSCLTALYLLHQLLQGVLCNDA